MVDVHIRNEHNMAVQPLAKGVSHDGSVINNLPNVQ